MTMTLKLRKSLRTVLLKFLPEVRFVFWQGKKHEMAQSPSGQTEPPVLRIIYSLKNPVEVHAFANSLEAFAELHRIQTARSDADAKDVRLFIRDIREGSIEVDLVEMIKTAGGALAPILADTHSVVETLKRVKDVATWLKGEEKKPENVTAKELELTKKALDPVASNHGSSLTMNVVNSPGAQVFIGSIDANAIQNQATRNIEHLREPVKQVLREVPLVWQQTDRQGAATGRTGMKAIVEEASDNPLPVYFPEDDTLSLRAKMVSDVEYPYKKTFIVDVETIVVLGKLKGIKLLRLHDVLD